MQSPVLKALLALVDSDRPALEAAGVRVEGYGGGSPEGPVWHFDFTLQWPLPPQRASVRVSLWWGPGLSDAEEPEVRVQRVAEVFSEGQPSAFRDTAASVVLVDDLLKNGLSGVIRERIEEGKRIIAASHPSA
jgi:hypothetical protein